MLTTYVWGSISNSYLFSIRCHIQTIQVIQRRHLRLLLGKLILTSNRHTITTMLPEKTFQHVLPRMASGSAQLTMPISRRIRKQISKYQALLHIWGLITCECRLDLADLSPGSIFVFVLPIELFQFCNCRHPNQRSATSTTWH